MPAIELARLARHTEELLDLLDNPADFRRACLNLLEGYADRTRRQGVWHPDEDVPWVLGVPRTVLRALANALAREVVGRSAEALEAAAALWATGLREGQALAAALVQTVPDVRAGEWVRERAAGAKDERALETLAGAAVGGWRRQDADGFLGRVEAWLGGAQPRTRALAYRALQAAFADPGFPRIPKAFDILGRQLREEVGEERQAARGAWNAAIARSPAESAQTLLEQMASGGEAARRRIAGHLESFPERQRARLRRALSGDASAGIIRPP